MHVLVEQANLESGQVVGASAVTELSGWILAPELGVREILALQKDT